MSRRGIVLTVCLLLFAALPGCHVLVRLGEEPSDVKHDAGLRGLDSDPSSIKAAPADGSPPPAPGLDAEPTSPPPHPGLDQSRVERPDSGDEFAGGSRSAFPNSRRSPLNANERWAIRRRLSGNTGINTNTAIAPGEGQFVYRTQLRFLESHTTPAPADIDVNVLVSPQVLAYGVQENLSVFGVVPLVKRDGTVRPPGGGVNELEDFGVGDMRFFAKYRLCEIDEPGETTRLSVFGGLEVPSYDKDFSSDSWDPFLGAVWTYQSLEWGLDLDWFWNFNTGRDVSRYDEMRYDAAYTYVLLTGQNLDDRYWQLNSIFEINGSYFTDNSHVVYVAPGFQLALERMIVEASLQLPIIREVRNGIEPDSTLVIGTRITW